MAGINSWKFSKFRILMELSIDKPMIGVEKNLNVLYIGDHFRGKMKYKKMYEYLLVYYLMAYSKEKITSTDEMLRTMLLPSPSHWDYPKSEEHFSNQQITVVYDSKEYIIHYKLSLKLAPDNTLISPINHERMIRSLEVVYGPEFKGFRRLADIAYKRKI
ncbi:MAG: hypothetical protein QKV39_gp3 [Xiangshan rhabdo-like virus 1]|uniref:Uncharacterized protein n=1 Tax=Xiangshan rhabdo-like virus 1 TaxID=2886224 RepID=A0A8K1YQP1_9RHAB|nr:MAG: hypothetical protein QKV39_gp3 [Xiangshan rhabdo-like virus 1]UDL13981.1 MAG: hypothetical protein [Xiangshan rhabdo-like virus 1]URZ95413.1 M protein [Shanxi Armigeres subalbatus rhabdovirus]